MRILATGVALLAMAASGFAATLKVPQQYPTIQEAVDASVDGDTIKVSAGVYRENVTVGARSGLKFLGKNAIWDGNIAGVQGPCLTAYNGGYLVQGFRFRNGDPILDLAGDGITVQKCTFQNGWSWCMDASGNHFVFRKNVVRNSYRGIQISVGDDAVVDGNQFRGVLSVQVQVVGDRAVIQRGFHSGTSESTGIQVIGADAFVSRNTARGCDGLNIHVTGSAAMVQGNALSAGYAGVYIEGSGAFVEGNRMRTMYYYSIQTNGNGNTVRDNEVVGSYDRAVDVGGEFNQILGNTLTDITSGNGIYCGGSSNTVDGNTVARTGNGGIQMAGGGSIRNNRVSDIWNGNGIYASGSGSTDIEDNVVTDVQGNGILYTSSGGSVSRNTVTGAGTYYSSGLVVIGSGVTLGSNTASGAGFRGFEIYGSSCLVADCVATDSGVDGFYVGGNSVTMTRCTARGNTGQGLYNAGANTIITDSTFLDNALDLANTGTFAGAGPGATYGTGGPAQAPEYFGYF